METCGHLSPITSLKLKVLSGQEIFNYFIDQIHLQDNELLIWAVKKEKKKLIRCPLPISNDFMDMTVKASYKLPEFYIFISFDAKK